MKTTTEKVYNLNASMCVWIVLLAMVWMASLTGAVQAREALIWKLGEADHSDREFTGLHEPSAKIEIHLTDGTEARQWPKFHPGSGNAAYGGQPHPFTLVFALSAEQTKGTLYLDLSLLFRHPRVPAVELNINGHRGRYYFEPEPMFELGSGDDQFNPIRSAARRKLSLPPGFFKAGENRLSLTAVDEPQTVVENNSVGGKGDSGFFYDALALSQDPDTTSEEKLEAALTPTVLFPRTAQGTREECWLTVRFPAGWAGGDARVSIGKFTAEIPTSNTAEFGEARYAFVVPGDLKPGAAQIALSTVKQPGRTDPPPPHVYRTAFVPARKWKVFYAANEHLDIGYTDYRPKVAEVLSRNLDELLKVFATHPDYRFNLDGSWIVEQWLASRSARQASVLAREARMGRIGLNALYSSFVTDYPSLETFIRSMYPSKQIQQRYGVPFDFANITDIPGNSWSVPSVLAAAGIRYFIDAGNQDHGPLIVHGHWNVRSPFWWEGPDGQRVLAWFSSHYHQLKAVCGLPPAIESGSGGLARFLKIYDQAAYAPDAVLLFGTQVENVPLDFSDADFVERWNKHFAYPQIIACRVPEFFQYLENHYAAQLPTVRGGAGSYWGEGFGSSALSTARDRANQTRVIGAEILSAMTATLDPVLRFPTETDHAIWRNILLYAEHTFGTARTGGQPEHPEVIGSLNEKENQAASAAADIDTFMRRSLSQLAFLIQTEGKNLLVFNPLSWERNALVTFTLDKGATLTDVATGKPVEYEVLAEKDGAINVRFEAERVPALGYKVYLLGKAAAKRRSPATAPAENVIENRFYRITLNPARAAIQSVYDKELGRELVDASSPYLLNEYLFVSAAEKGKTSYSEVWPWLPPAEITIHHAEHGSVVSSEKTPWGRAVRMTAAALHTPRLETEILLPDADKRIDLCNRFEVDLLREKQASYFAFPWAMENPAFRFDTPNGFLNPEKDLLEGACNEWFLIQHWVNATDGRASVDLAAADAPTVCLGDIYRGRWLPKYVKRSSTIFSQVINNTWSAHWAGKKSWELVSRYSLTSAGRFDPVRAARMGRQLRAPLETAEIKSSDKLPASRSLLPPGQGSLASLEPENLVLTALKPTEDGEGLIVRILEVAGKETDGRLKLSTVSIVSATEANAMEDPKKPLELDAGGVRFHVGPHRALTIRLGGRGQ